MRATLMLCLLAVAGLPAPSLPTVREEPIRAHMAFLSDDLLEGRGTGQRGGRSELVGSHLRRRLLLIVLPC